MKQSLEIDEFLKLYQNSLALSFVTDQVGLKREISLSRSAETTFQAVDFFNIIRTSSVVVIGFQEARYIHSMTTEEQTLLFTTLFQGPLSIILISRGNALPQPVLQLCQANNIPVMQSEMDDSDLVDNTRYLLSFALAESVDEHGVYIEVYSIGIFLNGQGGVGKSELALALISRGHRLISDDIIRFSRIEPNTIDGRSPVLLTDFMEVRGLGILNIREMFGANALRKNKTLRLIIKMVQLTSENSHQFDRIGKTASTRKILGVDIPEVTLPVAPGRNLAVIVEAAARNHLLNMKGYNAAEDFIARQRKAIDSNQNQGNLK